MRGLTHRWVTTQVEAKPSGEAALSAGVDPLVARVLAARGLSDPAAAATFCNPRLTSLHDPSLIPDLDKAAERLLKATLNAESIVIYGDYDVDGICAAAILFHVVTALTPAGKQPRVQTYVPHRVDEGYGLHVDAIETLAASPVSTTLIVSVDCGVTAFEPAKRARQLGVDLIITDHHTPPAAAAGLPPAMAVVHPGLAGSRYPFPELCGAGVAFKLAWRLATLANGSERVSPAIRALLIDMLALAALGTIADVVPLRDENRVIAKFGLDQLKRCRNVGVQALIDSAGLAGEEIDSERVGFVLAPRLNACGRMGHAREALEMLTVATPARAREIAQSLDKANRERRETEGGIFAQACEMAEKAGMTGDACRAIVLSGQGWHAGVVGIVCSRIIGRFHRPTILLARSEETSHGSGRSIDGFNLHEGISKGAHLLEKFGGHDMAAGMVVRNEHFDEFVQIFTQWANEKITPEMLTPPLRVDCEARLDEFTESAVVQLAGLGPFGRGNPRPCIMVRGAKPLRDAEPMGKGGAHMNVQIAQGGVAMRLVGWKWGDRRGSIRAGRAMDFALQPKINDWNGRRSVEAEIFDVRVD